MNIGEGYTYTYKGCKWNCTVIGREYPYWIIELSNGLELRVYADELEWEVWRVLIINI